ncbi:hypothetical protein [Xanthomonas phage JGB6]|nr:hypothetical protein [Xanthomonas phage JGB6]
MNRSAYNSSAETQVKRIPVEAINDVLHDLETFKITDDYEVTLDPDQLRQGFFEVGCQTVEIQKARDLLEAIDNALVLGRLLWKKTHWITSRPSPRLPRKLRRRPLRSEAPNELARHIAGHLHRPETRGRHCMVVVAGVQSDPAALALYFIAHCWLSSEQA